MKLRLDQCGNVYVDGDACCSRIRNAIKFRPGGAPLLKYENENKLCLMDGEKHGHIEVEFCPWCGEKMEVALTPAQVVEVPIEVWKSIQAALKRGVDCYDLDGDCIRTADLQAMRDALALAETINIEDEVTDAS